MGFWKPAVVSISLILTGLFCSGCQKGRSDSLLEVTVQAPVEEQLEAPGFQQRILPWDNTDLSVSVPMRLYSTKKQQVSLQDSPGLYAIEQRLNARARGLDDLSRRLAVLPAAEAPPGEKIGPRMSDFSDDYPGVEQVVLKQFETGFSEQLRVGRQGNAALSITLPLRPIAQSVLEHGGGFTPEHEVSRELSAVSLAKKKALKDARNQLRDKIYALPAMKGITYGDWAQLNTLNYNKVEELIRSARVEQSEKKVNEQGETEWMMKLVLDPSSLKKEIKLEEEFLKDVSQRKKEMEEGQSQ